MKYSVLIFIILFQISCAQESNSFKNEYPNRHIGDIEFDSKLDNPDFKLCYPENVFQYFNWGDGLEFEEEKIKIDNIFSEKYNPKSAKKESGSIRIRFIVNCKGETDRFRIIGSDENYQEKEFDKSITDQLLSIIKSLNGWKLKYFRENENQPIDYYQYLIFKIENGQIVKILP
ncbi:hypothetical protein [Moheibacter sediminis]|uniref:TonB C-terminal domain-containing protein n=1 Tax=Moheibacter sediminis TaxID=1434700 RepID=A0A1W2A819_9FLAO|nr:hypothetical protein [Moheibacter sediminis]SMC56786.1 hypothetical protein SAMN06296427_10419 [Moheibacter sediminis]